MCNQTQKHMKKAHYYGYPVIHHYSDLIPYVITVVADKKNYFKIEKKKLYKWIFKHFAMRMGLEHSLLMLKNEVRK